MTVLIMNNLNKLVKAEDRTRELWEELKKQPKTTLFKVKSDKEYYLLLKVGNNVVIDLFSKKSYKFSQKTLRGPRLHSTSDISVTIPVREFKIEIAKLYLQED